MESAISDFRIAYNLNPKNLDAAREVRVYEMRRGKQPEQRRLDAARQQIGPAIHAPVDFAATTLDLATAEKGRRVVGPRQVFQALNRHRGRGLAFALGALCTLLGSPGCRAPEPLERRIVPHALAGCRYDRVGTLLVTALGDFAPTGVSSSVQPDFSGAIEVPSTFAGATVQVLPQGWQGVGYAPYPDDVDVLLWSSEDGCNVGAQSIPANRGAWPSPPLATEPAFS